MDEEQFQNAMESQGVEVKAQESEKTDAKVAVSENKEESGEETRQEAVQQQKTAEVPQDGQLTIPPDQIDELRRMEAGAKEGIQIAEGVLDDLKSADDADKEEVIATIKERLLEKFPDGSFANLKEAGLRKFARDLKSHWSNYLSVELPKSAKFLAEKNEYDKHAVKKHPWLNDNNSPLKKEFDRYVKKYETHFNTVPEFTYLLANALRYDELLGKTKVKEGKSLNLTGDKGRGQPTDAAPKTNQTAVQSSVKAAIDKLKEKPDDDNLRTNVFAAQIDEDARNGIMPPGLARMLATSR